MQRHKAHTVKVLDLLDAFGIAVSEGLHRQACRSSDLKTKTKSARDMKVTTMRWIKRWHLCTMNMFVTLRIQNRTESETENLAKSSCIKMSQDLIVKKCSSDNDEFCEIFMVSKVAQQTEWKISKLNSRTHGSIGPNPLRDGYCWAKHLPECQRIQSGCE